MEKKEQKEGSEGGGNEQMNGEGRHAGKHERDREREGGGRGAKRERGGVHTQQ